jgi:hypothetical protein
MKNFRLIHVLLILAKLKIYIAVLQTNSDVRALEHLIVGLENCIYKILNIINKCVI